MPTKHHSHLIRALTPLAHSLAQQKGHKLFTFFTEENENHCIYCGSTLKLNLIMKTVSGDAIKLLCEDVKRDNPIIEKEVYETKRSIIDDGFVYDFYNVIEKDDHFIISGKSKRRNLKYISCYRAQKVNNGFTCGPLIQEEISRVWYFRVEKGKKEDASEI